MLELCILLGIMVVFIICAFAIKKPITDSEQPFLDRNTTNTLKGISILLVFFHHWGQLTSTTYNSYSFIGYLAVTVFLFVAGYVSQIQYMTRGGVYVSWKFIWNKIKRIYLPYVLAVLFFAIIGRHEIKATLISIVNITENWFVTAILIYYLMFFIINKLIPQDKFKLKLIVYAACIVIYCVVCICLNVSSTWYNTSWAFVIGILAAYLNTCFKNFNLKKYQIIILAVIFIAATVCSAFRMFETATSMISSICLSCLLYALSKKYMFHNRLLEYMGMISWEFYLVHINVLFIIMDRINNSLLILVVSLAVALAIAICFNFVFNKSFELLNKVLSKKKKYE